MTGTGSCEIRDPGASASLVTGTCSGICDVRGSDEVVVSVPAGVGNRVTEHERLGRTAPQPPPCSVSCEPGRHRRTRRRTAPSKRTSLGTGRAMDPVVDWPIAMNGTGMSKLQCTRQPFAPNGSRLRGRACPDLVRLSPSTTIPELVRGTALIPSRNVAASRGGEQG